MHSLNAEQWIILLVLALVILLAAFCVFIAPFVISSRCSRQEEKEEAEKQRRAVQ